MADLAEISTLLRSGSGLKGASPGCDLDLTSVDGALIVELDLLGPFAVSVV